MRRYDLRGLLCPEGGGAPQPLTCNGGAETPTAAWGGIGGRGDAAGAGGGGGAGGPHAPGRPRRASMSALVRAIAQMQLREQAAARWGEGAGGEAPGSPLALASTAATTSAAHPMAAALRRSTQYLNGVPCFLAEAFRAAGGALTPLPALAAAIEGAVADARAGAGELPADLLDELIVRGVAYLEADAFPRFAASAGLAVYAQMQHFAFTRPPLTRACFRWVKVRGRGWGRRAGGQDTESAARAQ